MQAIDYNLESLPNMNPHPHVSISKAHHQQQPSPVATPFSSVTCHSQLHNISHGFVWSNKSPHWSASKVAIPPPRCRRPNFKHKTWELWSIIIFPSLFILLWIQCLFSTTRGLHKVACLPAFRIQSLTAISIPNSMECWLAGVVLLLLLLPCLLRLPSRGSLVHQNHNCGYTEAEE